MAGKGKPLKGVGTINYKMLFQILMQEIVI